MRRLAVIFLLCSCSGIDNLDLPLELPGREIKHGTLPPPPEKLNHQNLRSSTESRFRPLTTQYPSFLINRAA